MRDTGHYIKGLLGITVAALLLSACASTRPGTPTAATPLEATAKEPASDTSGSELPPEVRPRPRPFFDAKRFVGLDPAGVTRILGAPALRQQETFAEVWQYLSGACVLHLYFYRPKNSPADGPFKVDQALIETRPGPWGDNLNPQGICALEFSGRAPVSPAPPRPAPPLPAVKPAP
ncbi:hypothetical protein [Govanella unica]|uniref:Lipoprotein n=1 Tax=Govanella unica TaxID=2975056 RepID=A0A9X3TZK4_9PROT|nr:hypothetical protein [Govania unica]MDA5194666.1 hypothetical protein [Govania unica]